MTQSMTAFATLSGASDNRHWTWEMRGVNARGLDLKMRLPEGCEPLEKEIKSTVTKHCRRGSIFVGLKLQHSQSGGALAINQEYLHQLMQAALNVETQATEMGLTLKPATAIDLLAVKGVLEQGSQNESQIPTWLGQVKASISDLVTQFNDARAAEGQALGNILSSQLDEIERLLTMARGFLRERREHQAQILKENLMRLIENTDGLDDARLTQELAILAVKSDIAEEMDRLNAHVDAARGLLETKGPIGRKFDFLTQEFNREANTLCAKAGSKSLTQTGLDLKTVIDQMREQVQNVE